MADSRTKITLLGSLVLYCQEGGYASDEINIDGVDLAEYIANAWKLERNPPHGNYLGGMVRITVEPWTDGEYTG